MSKKSLLALRLPLLVLALLAWALQAFGGLDRLDNALADQLIARQARSRPPPDDIVLVAIDQKSLEDLNALAGSWPWPRAIYAELIEGLAAHRPAALGFDIHFNEADTFRPDSDMYLVETARTHAAWLYFPSMLLSDGNRTSFRLLPASFGAKRLPKAAAAAGAPLLLPLALDPVNWRGGLVNFIRDADGVGRRAEAWREIGGWRLPGFAANIARDAGARLPEQPRFRLHWYGRPPPRIAFSDLFNDLQSGQPVLAPTLRGKILLVGATTTGLHDLRPTPLHSQMVAVEILTTAIANLRAEDWLRDVPTRWPLLAVLLLGLVLGFARELGAVGLGLGLSAASLGLAGGSYALLGINHHAPVGAALGLAWLAYLLLTAQAQWRAHRQRQATVSMFQRFLDPQVVRELVAKEELSLQEKPLSREISVLFSDIRGFTSLSETRSPEAVVELLNRYFTRQTAVVFRNQGTLDKFIGDCIMAFWNAPAEVPRHACCAVTAALEMADELDAFRRELLQVEPDLGDFDVGIGIHTGLAVVGFLGSDARLDYTVIGDTVNLGSRIESTTKGVARVLVSEATRDACGADGPFEFEAKGEFHVKGREQPVRLYEPRRRLPAPRPPSTS